MTTMWRALNQRGLRRVYAQSLRKSFLHRFLGCLWSGGKIEAVLCMPVLFCKIVLKNTLFISMNFTPLNFFYTSLFILKHSTRVNFFINVFTII